MNKKHFDVIVIGGGSGAKLASSLSKIGYNCAVIDRDVLGGTCLNRGCIPSKMLIHSAELARHFQRAKFFNLKTEKVSCAFSKLVSRVSREVDQRSDEMVQGIEENSMLTFFHNEASFLDAKTLQVGKKKLSADFIFIASGAHPFIPKIPGLEKTPYLTSKDALRLKKLPNHLIIIGGGYIAAELGFYFSALGAKVTILARSQLLSKEDRDIRKEFADIFCKYATVNTYTLPLSISHQKRYFLVECKYGLLKGDQLLVATGLRGSTKALKLKKTKISVNSKGFINVNHYLQTEEKHIFAFGDAIGPPFFRHKANFQADYLLNSQFLSKKPHPIAPRSIPHAIFSYPQVSGIGKSERELKKEKIPYISGRCDYADTARGLAILPEGGFVKLLFEKNSQKLLGAHIVGEDAATLCHITSAFIVKKASLSDIVQMIYIHPSLPEVILKAAQNALQEFNS